MELEFDLDTDTEHEIELESQLIAVIWDCNRAFAGETAPFKVRTALVGAQAPIKISCLTAEGKTVSKTRGVVKANKFESEIEIPEDIQRGLSLHLEVELPDNELSGESEEVRAYPPINVTNMRWSEKEARRGDQLTLSAEIEGLHSGDEVTVTIYDHDEKRGTEEVTELPAIVRDRKIEIEWQYQYHESTADIPTESELQESGRHYRHPEYFFTVRVDTKEFGLDQQSGMLKFKDYLEINVTSFSFDDVAELEYVLHLPDGSERRGHLDETGHARKENLPPGKILIEFPGRDDIVSSDD